VPIRAAVLEEFGAPLEVQDLEGAAMFTAEVEPGSTCVVFGAGMVGLGAVAGCRLQAAERVICVDLSAERLELARGQGATDVLPGGEDAVDRVLEMTGGFGADYTFEATGNVKVMAQAVAAARMGGACARSRAWPAGGRPSTSCPGS
jgi:S-(hydroxymethyl)glutathione dehydrogenase/alcohol dehydrogenase